MKSDQNLDPGIESSLLKCLRFNEWKEFFQLIIDNHVIECTIENYNCVPF